MNYKRIIGHTFPETSIFFVEDTYDSLVWWDEDTQKPTDDEIITYYNSYMTEWAKEEMKQHRNMLLIGCDYCALPDYPNRDKWIAYRQELRDFPENWTIDTPFPQKPT